MCVGERERALWFVFSPQEVHTFSTETKKLVTVDSVAAGGVVDSLNYNRAVGCSVSSGSPREASGCTEGTDVFRLRRSRGYECLSVCGCRRRSASSADAATEKAS